MPTSSLTHYLDIHLRPDPEFPAPLLLSALYAKLHRALVQSGTDQIAVSFPQIARHGLGTHLRLLGPPEALNQLLSQNWLGAMQGHVQLRPLAPVPPQHEHRILKRVQAKTGAERLRRRQMKRHGISYEQATERVPTGNAQQLNLPFVQLASSSTGQRFSLFLQLGVAAQATAGTFNSYGLSQTATIPWF